MSSAAASLAGYQPFSSTSQNNATTVAKNKNYLDRCIEDLSTSDSNAAQMDRNATASKIRAYAVLALFIAAAAAATIITGLIAPAYVPIAMITILCFTNPALEYYKGFLATAENHQGAAEKTRTIAREYQAIQNQDSRVTNGQIAHLTSHSSRDIDDRLKVLLAHYNYWQHLYTVYDTEAQKRIGQARQTDNREQNVIHYMMAAHARHQALIAKVSAAFIIAVMNNPTFQKNAADICSLKNFNLPVDYAEMTISASLKTNPWAQHVLFHEFDDTRADDVVVFKNINIALSLNQAKKLSAQEISEYILLAMRT